MSAYLYQRSTRLEGSVELLAPVERTDDGSSFDVVMISLLCSALFADSGSFQPSEVEIGGLAVKVDKKSKCATYSLIMGPKWAVQQKRWTGLN